MGSHADSSLQHSAAGASAPAAKPVTVLVVDDQATFRQAACDLIAAMPGFVVVGEAASGPEALAVATRLDPDLVLLDLRMPQMDGIETCRRLAATNPRSVVVLISVEPVTDLPRAPGAAAHLRKQEISASVLRAIWRSHAPEPAI